MKKIFLFALLSLSIQLVSAQNFNMELVGQLDYSPKLNDVWGYVDSLGNEYALVGTNTPGGVSVVDLSDPENPVEISFVEDVASLWRDMKSWGTHAYATNEAGGGLLIIDLSSLPDASGITSTRYTGPDGNTWSSAHNIFIDEFGFAYIFGASRGNGGAIILDLSDPDNPVEVGTYETAYIHDGMVKNNIMYTGNIYVGTFSVVDVTDKANPVYLGGHETPSEFTHNIWVSDDGNNVYTTDEVSGGYLAGYDISNLDDIVETDKSRVSPNTSVTIHNAHFMDNYVITSYYDEGVTIHDVSDPENIVLTGHYDTAPSNSSGFGAWGAYPYLPSGLVLASDNAEGLFVLQPSYTRAARVEGEVTDIMTGDPIFNAQIEIVNTDVVDQSNVSGTYKIGTAEPGFYSIKVSKSGYPDKIIDNVELINGDILELNVALGDDAVGVNELNAEANFKVFPNPASGHFYIDMDIVFSENLEEIFILDLSGKRVYSQGVSTISGRISVEPGLENGTYFLNLLWKDQSISVSKVLITD